MSNNLLAVGFDGDTLDLIPYDGQPFVACKPISDALGLAWTGQFQKLAQFKDRWTVKEIFTVASDGGQRKMVSMPLRKLPAWLYSIKPGKVASHVRTKLERYQTECDEVLWKHWGAKASAAQVTVDEINTIIDAAKPGEIGKEARKTAMDVMSRIHSAEVVEVSDTRLDRIEDNLAQLVEVSLQQARKMDMVEKYMTILEQNQRGRVRVTPEIERQVHAMKAEGMGQSDIARMLRLSSATVSLLVNGKYPRNSELAAAGAQP